MIRTGKEYIDSIRDERQVWINGERVKDVPAHPTFKPLVDVRARIYDMAHKKRHQDVKSYLDKKSGERYAVALKRPHTQQDWQDKRRAVDAVTDDIGGVVTRAGDETIGEIWLLSFVKSAAGLSDRVMGEKKKEKAA